MIAISNGIQKNAVRCVIYGTEGIGKSTLASKAPEAVFVDLENGTSRLDVNRIECIDTWEKLFQLPAEILKTSNPFSICRTLVIDTADRADEMCMEHICQKHKVSGIEDIGYGKGYVYAAEEFDRFLGELDTLMAAGINIILTSHSYLRKQELPHDEGAFDRYELKLSKKTAPLLKEWCDMLLFCNYREYVVESDKTKTKKVSGGQRVIYTQHHPCWDAKNRYGLPDPMDMSFAKLESLFTDVVPFDQRLKKTPVTPQQAVQAPAADTDTTADLTELQAKLKELIDASGLSEEQVIQVAAARGRCETGSKLADLPDALIKQWFIPNWEKIKSEINKKKGK